MTDWIAYSVLGLSVLLTTAGQLLLKFSISAQQFSPKTRFLYTTLAVAALLSSTVAVVFSLKSVSFTVFSQARIAIMVLILLGSWKYFQERLSSLHYVGIGCITLGSVLYIF